MLSIIVAKAKNNVIGKNNQLIWHLPEDLKHFKELTTGHTIIMGKNTFESLGRVLPNRKHVVFAYDGELDIDDENVKIVNSIDQIQNLIEGSEEAFVIGGAMMYKFLMPYCEKMYITEIDEEFDGDVKFPEIDLSKWQITDSKPGLKNEKNPFNYNYVTYKKIEK